MKFIKWAFGKFNKLNMKWSCLSYEILNAILSPSKFDYFNENLHCSNGRRHNITCSRQKCYVMCGHNIIYDMMLSTE